MDKRSLLEIKINALYKLIMCNTLSGVLPLYIVTEYQKSGGTWIAQMLSEYLQVPFPDNHFPSIEKSVFHGHLMPTPFLKNVLCVYRDGRDAMVSSYFHMIFGNRKSVPSLVTQTRQNLNFTDYDDVKRNLPEFIEYLYTRFHKKSITRWHQFTWSEFVSAWKDLNVSSVKYEDMVVDPVKEMSVLISELTEEKVDMERLKAVVDKYSFENQSKRKPGQELKDSFLRKGKPGDWKEKFSRDAAEVFHHYAGKELIALGYEQDSSWINKFDSTEHK